MNGRPRAPTPADAPALAALIEATLGGARDADHLLTPTLGTVRLAITDDRGPCAWIEYRVVADEAELIEIAVAPRARRRGHGRRLIAHLVDDARGRGVGAIHLEVRAGNRAARALYTACGFIDVGRRRRYYADGEDAVVCSLTLEDER